MATLNLALLFLSVAVGVYAVSNDHLECYRCFQSTCDQDVNDPTICEATKEFLAQMGTSSNHNFSLISSSDHPCPAPTDNWHKPELIETSSHPNSFCGKRVLKIRTIKHPKETEAVTQATPEPGEEGNNDTSTSTLSTTTTPFPILKPQGPMEYHHKLIIYSCTVPEDTCDREKYAVESYNKTEPESGILLEFHAELTDESDCTRCKVNLCNKDVPFHNPGINAPVSSSGRLELSFVTILCMMGLSKF